MVLWIPPPMARLGATASLDVVIRGSRLARVLTTPVPGARVSRAVVVRNPEN